MRFAVVLLFSTLAVAQSRPANPFDQLKFQHRKASVSQLPLGRVASNFLSRHPDANRRFKFLSNNFTLDLSGPRLLPGSPALNSALKWRKK